MAETKAKLQSMAEKLDAFPVTELNLNQSLMLNAIKYRLRELSVEMVDTRLNLQSIAICLQRLIYEIFMVLDNAQVIMLIRMKVELDEIIEAEGDNEPLLLSQSGKLGLWKLSVPMADTKKELLSIAENLNRLNYENNLDVAQVTMLNSMRLELDELIKAGMFNEKGITCPSCLAAVCTEHKYLLIASELRGNLKKDLTLNDFMCYLGNSLRNIPPMYQKALLGLCASYILPPMQNNIAPFENSQLGKTKAPPLLLTFGEAFKAFNPEITHITKFLLCVILTAVLIFRLPPPGVQIISMLILIATFFLGFLEMAHSASKTGVTCGSIHLPVFWFTTLSAVGISIIFGLFTLFVFYIIWRLSKGKPQANDDDDDVSLNDFVGDIEEGN